MMPKISVIIPVYNKEAYVETAIRSVLDQPYEDVELIVVNDGSGDRSLEIVQRLAEDDCRIRVIDVPNGGVSSARNIGLANARGEWIQFLDADDILEEAYLSRAMKVLEETPADILFTGFTMVNERMQPVKTVELPIEGMMNQRQLCDCFIRYQYENGFFGYISNKLFRRSLLEKSGARFPVGVTLAEDLDFYSKLYPAVEWAYFLREKSFFYLQTQENYIHNPKIDYFSQIQIQLDIRTWFRQSGLYEVYQAVLDKRIAQYAYYILFDANERKADVKAAFRALCEREEIMSAVLPAYGKGFERLILRALAKENLWAIRSMFALRNGIRRLYRTVRRA